MAGRVAESRITFSPGVGPFKWSRMRARQTQHIGLGLRANLAQFSLLVGVNALVGGMTGQERTVLPLLAEDRFGLDGITATMTFILAFGIVKAVANFSAGALADRFGRKPILIAGWLFGIPVPLLLIWAPTWAWVVFANGLLGINQGLCWSTTVIMKINLVGSRNRGLAMGLNEAAGYLAVSLTALLTGLAAARSGLSPEPFFFGLAYAGLGLGLSVIGVRETRQHARLEAQNTKSSRPDLPLREVFALTTIRDRSLSAVTQAGLVNNLNDGMALGPAAHLLRSQWSRCRPDRDTRCGIPSSVGTGPAGHRGLVGSDRPQAPHSGRNVHSGGRDRRHRCVRRLLALVGGIGGARYQHGSRLPDPTRGCRRQSKSPVESLCGRCIPFLARRGIRHRRPPCRRHRRPH